MATYSKNKLTGEFDRLKAFWEIQHLAITFFEPDISDLKAVVLNSRENFENRKREN